MKVQELIDVLEDLEPNDIVYLVSQDGRHALQYTVDDAVAMSGEEAGCYIVEGNQVGYLSGELCQDVLGE